MTSDVGVLVLSRYDARIAGGQDSSVFIPVKGRAFLCEVYRCSATRRKTASRSLLRDRPCGTGTDDRAVCRAL
jgi:hypothetical protein